MRYWTKPVVRHTSTVELELQGENRRVTAKVLNGHTYSLETRILELNLESLVVKMYVKKAAFTSEHVSGNIGVIKWTKYAKKWEYLKGFTLPWSTPNHARCREYQPERDVG